MMRCTIELVPGGDESRKRVIGLVEVANIGGTPERGDYAVVLKKTPPFSGALKVAWRKGLVTDVEGILKGICSSVEDDDMISGAVIGHHRSRRGSYDLLYQALVACGMDKRGKG